MATSKPWVVNASSLIVLGKIGDWTYCTGCLAILLYRESQAGTRRERL